MKVQIITLRNVPCWLTDDVRERLHDRFDVEAYDDGAVKLTPKKRG